MKILKLIINSILALVMLLCMAVLVCAFNPSLTDVLAAKLGTSGQDGSYTVEIGPAGGDGNSSNGDNGEENSTNTDYIMPSQSDVASPEAVRGKSGYVPVREDGEQIADADAEALQDKLQTGDIGEDLNFDPVYYPYYHMLNENSQAMYRQIFSNAMNLTESFAPAVSVTLDEVKNAFEAVYNDHPELFWLETGYSCKYLQNGKCIELTLQYHPVAENLEEARTRFAATAQGILEGAKVFSTDQEIEKFVHDALMKKVRYDASVSMGQSAYSALVNGSSVCAGYARAFQYLMMTQGIPAYYCTGYSGEDHAWNIVRIDGGYYNVDVTWDDTEPSTYDYYNKTDAEYAKTHIRKSLSVNLPACNGAKSQGSVQDKNDGDLDNAVANGSDGAEAGENNPDNIDTDSLINPNPQKPLTWFSREPDDSNADDKDDKESNLEKAGLTEDEVMDDMKEYYVDCLEQMIAVGRGKQQFVNAVPKSLWSSIERAYSDESYKNGYVKEALKKLEMENFAIQLQVEDLGGGYYKLYHNISTW